MAFDRDSAYEETNILIQPMFRLEEVNRTINVLGYMLEAYESHPVSTTTLERIAEFATQYAKDLVIEQGAVSTIPKYHLKDSIKWRTSGNQIQIYSDIRDDITQYPYAGSVEYGFHPWGRSKFIPPRPFLRPALQLALDLTKSNFETATMYMLDNIGLFNNFHGLDMFTTKTSGMRLTYGSVGTKGHRQASMQNMINTRREGHMSSQRRESIQRAARTTESNRSNLGVQNKGLYARNWKITGREGVYNTHHDPSYTGRRG